VEHAAGRTTARLSARTTMQASTSTKATSIRRRLAICRVEEEGLAGNVGRASTGFSVLHLLTRSNWSENFYVVTYTYLLRGTCRVEHLPSDVGRRPKTAPGGTRPIPTTTNVTTAVTTAAPMASLSRCLAPRLLTLLLLLVAPP
jgi:hypothetical protein